MKWFKRKARNGWARVKRWWVAVLVSLGLITGVVYAEQKTSAYTNATTRIDGSPFPASDLQETRVYCDGSVVVTVTDGSAEAQADLGVGSHTCHATHVDTNGQESPPSNSVTFIVAPALPSAPTNFSVN